MDITLYTQYYRCKTADRQQEIDECLRHNLNHPGVTKVMLLKESDAPPLPEATVELEVVESNKRITYAEWLHWVKRQSSGIALLLNADIYLDRGLEHLTATFETSEAFLALTRYNLGRTGFHLNDNTHWTQDVWEVRADAQLPESLLYARSFPLGFPGCDNRITYMMMWRQDIRVHDSCHHMRSMLLQTSTTRHYDKTSDRLYCSGSTGYRSWRVKKIQIWSLFRGCAYRRSRRLYPQPGTLHPRAAGGALQGICQEGCEPTAEGGAQMIHSNPGTGKNLSIKGLADPDADVFRHHWNILCSPLESNRTRESIRYCHVNQPYKPNNSLYPSLSIRTQLYIS